MQEDWVPPILRTIATAEDGMAEVWDAIEQHYEFLNAAENCNNWKMSACEKSWMICCKPDW